MSSGIFGISITSNNFLNFRRLQLEKVYFFLAFKKKGGTHARHYLETSRGSPNTTSMTIDGGLRYISSTNKVVINVGLPRHVCEKKKEFVFFWNKKGKQEKSSKEKKEVLKIVCCRIMKSSRVSKVLWIDSKAVIKACFNAYWTLSMVYVHMYLLIWMTYPIITQSKSCANNLVRMLWSQTMLSYKLDPFHKLWKRLQDTQM